jgi:hypothetical protein
MSQATKPKMQLNPYTNIGYTMRGWYNENIKSTHKFFPYTEKQCIKKFRKFFSDRRSRCIVHFLSDNLNKKIKETLESKLPQMDKVMELMRDIKEEIGVKTDSINAIFTQTGERYKEVFSKKLDQMAQHKALVTAISMFLRLVQIVSSRIPNKFDYTSLRDRSIENPLRKAIDRFESNLDSFHGTQRILAGYNLVYKWVKTSLGENAKNDLNFCLSKYFKN